MKFGDFISGATASSGLISGISGIIQGRKIRKAQQEANNQNIALTEKWNNIQRNDSLHSDLIRRSSLSEAGYSTADPNNSGFSVQNMASPAVDSEYNADSANVTQNGFANLTSSLVEASKIPASIALSKAQTRAQNASATFQEISNNYADAEHKANIANLQETTNNLVATNKLTSKQAEKISRDIQALDVSMQSIQEEIKAKKFANEHQEERFYKELKLIEAQIFSHMSSGKFNLVNASIGKLKGFYLENGISPDSADMMSSLFRMLLHGNATTLVDGACNFIKTAFDSINHKVDHTDPFTASDYFHMGLQNPMVPLMIKTSRFFHRDKY